MHGFQDQFEVIAGLPRPFGHFFRTAIVETSRILQPGWRLLISIARSIRTKRKPLSGYPTAKGFLFSEQEKR